MKIDRPKLKQAIKDIEADSRCRRGKYVRFDNQPGASWTWYLDPATALYCLAASLRGKMHMTHKWAPFCDSSGCRKKIEVTKADQDRFIEDLLPEFALEEAATGTDG